MPQFKNWLLKHRYNVLSTKEFGSEITSFTYTIVRCMGFKYRNIYKKSRIDLFYNFTYLLIKYQMTITNLLASLNLYQTLDENRKYV